MLNSTRNILLGGAALLLSATSVLAATGVDGTIDITGSVGNRCVVIGGATDSTFTDSVDLSNLDANDGTLLGTYASSTAGSPAGTKSFRVNCNTGVVDVGIVADSLKTGDGTAPAGYAELVHYTAQLDLNLATGSFTPLTVASAIAPATTPATSSTTAPLQNAAGNVTVSFYGLNTPAATDLLVAGTYGGQIRVTIAPGI